MALYNSSAIINRGLSPDTEIQQADFYSRWFPDTLGASIALLKYSLYHHQKHILKKQNVYLGIDKPSDLSELMEAYKNDRQRLPCWQFDSFSPSVLLGYEQLATKA